MTVAADANIGDVGSFVIRTPDGLVVVSRLPKIGTQVFVYDDEDDNPSFYTTIKDKT